jgi:outer membrane protein assembly factor BamB
VVSADDGKEVRFFPWREEWNINAAMPVYADGKIFITGSIGGKGGSVMGGALVDISKGKAQQVWRNKEMALHGNSPVLYQGYLYGVSGSFGNRGELKCVDFATGQAKWTHKGVEVGSLIVADGKLIVLDGKGGLILAEAGPDGYKELAKRKAMSGQCWTMPALANGKLYIRNNRPGELVCLDLRGDSK